MEEFKQHPVHSFLSVSRDGRIYSHKTNRILKTYINKKGYELLSVSHLGKKTLLRVHRLVAETYVENVENKPFINHKDCDKLNNNVENLEWVTNQENIDHATKNNLWNPYKGAENCFAKLTNEDVKFIRTNYKARDKVFGCRALARKYGVTHRTIHEVVHHYSYK